MPKISISYRKLWKLLIDKDMKKVDLMRCTGISSNALSHLSKGESVSLDVIGKICRELDCTPDEILEFIYTKEVCER